MRVIGLGDNVVDMYMHRNVMYPGGNAMNFAVYANLMGVESAYLGVFGSDDAAAHVHDTAQTLGLDMSQDYSHNKYIDLSLHHSSHLQSKIFLKQDYNT